MTVCVSCRVRGVVQGVFFRASTRDQAQALGLNGWVRNMPDGSVEVLACGPDVAVQALQSWLWQGPPGASVDEVLCGDAPDPVMAGFEIRYR